LPASSPCSFAWFVCLLGAALVQALRFDGDYLVVEYIVHPGLLLGPILSFVGVAAWAPWLERATRLAVELALLLMCALAAAAPLHPNIHGWGAFLLPVMAVAAPLGLAILVMAALPE
jgi:hypothetical protein